MSNEPKPLKILHVVGGMGRGGAEMWLMNMLRSMDRERFRMDFLVHTEEPRALDDEIRSLGSKVLPCMHPHQPLDYAKNFRRIVLEQGPYDIIHSAVHHFSGYVLRLASQCGIAGRIAHSHNTSAGVGGNDRFARRLYFRAMERWIRQYATMGLACSSPAAAALFGEHWINDPRWRVHYPSTDLHPFRAAVNRAEVRAELGIPADAYVIGHVGRFDPQKNHSFLMEIANTTLRRHPRAWFLLIGDGPLRCETQRLAEQTGLDDRIIFAGSRGDVPRLMLGAMDVFTLPSLHEGLPLVLVEAQAAGLPVVISDVITPEAGVVDGLSSRLALTRVTAEWAEELLAWETRAKPTQNAALSQVADSPYNAENAVLDLERVYLRAGGRPALGRRVGDAAPVQA